MGESGQLTRRTMLAQTAAGAAMLLSPHLATAAGDPGRITSRALGSLGDTPRAIRPPAAAVLVGVQWSTPSHPSLELRVLDGVGRWGGWVSAASQGHDPDGAGSQGEARFGEPLWIGRGSQWIELRSRDEVNDVVLHFISQAPAPSAKAAVAYPRAQPVLDAGPGQPPIIARRGWAQGQAPPERLAGYGRILLAFVHHTVNPNGYSAADVPAMLRAIFDYHRYVRGFFDIAYNFLIDAYGRIWEGRAGGIDMAVIGAHAGAYNQESTGVAMLGDFTSVVPSTAALRALEHLLAWKLSLHGVPAHGKTRVLVEPMDAFYTPFRPGAHVLLPRIAGHRDGDLTDCPGNALYARLPAIRRRVAPLAGVPAVITFVAPRATAGQPVALGGAIGMSRGTPLAGAAVEIQQLHWRPGAAHASTETLARTVSSSGGAWQASVTLEHNAFLRALHRAAPAAVSDWQQVDVALAIALNLVSTAPLQVSGTIAPGHRRVLVTLYRAGHLHRPIAVRHANGSQRSFEVTLPSPPPGDYVVIARTRASSLNAAGSSPPVRVTIT